MFESLKKFTGKPMTQNTDDIEKVFEQTRSTTIETVKKLQDANDRLASIIEELQKISKLPVRQ